MGKVKLYKKPPSALLRMAKKYKVRVTIKRGSRKIYKSVRLLKMQIRKKRKALKKKLALKKHSKRYRVRSTRRSRFGGGEVLQTGQGTGVYRDFFGNQVPANLGPEWNSMVQQDGSYVMTGSPFYAYSK